MLVILILGAGAVKLFSRGFLPYFYLLCIGALFGLIFYAIYVGVIKTKYIIEKTKIKHKK